MQKLTERMNAKTSNERLSALKEYCKREKSGEFSKPVARLNDANNHIHTIYSFSPYSPTLAAFKAYQSGLTTMGIMDHDSLSGAKEFLAACKLLKVSGTVGFEFRVHFKLPDTENIRINNPDQSDHAYIAVHGVPYQSIDGLNKKLQRYRDFRNIRNRQMTDKINTKFSEFDISLDFEKDVLPLSQAPEGGSVTERHLMYALSQKITEKYGKGQPVVDFLTQKLNLSVEGKIKDFLLDGENKFYLYDLLGVLKSDARFFYIPATEESCDIKEIIAMAKEAGAIPAYPYLGDVAGSVTGDKRAQKFEDDILDTLIPTVASLGISTIAYMPTRNTMEQLDRLRNLCKTYGFFEISGEDINSPRQKFECEALKKPEFSNLIESTWALIGHEKTATKNIEDGMFTAKTVNNYPSMEERLKHFAKIGQES